MFAQIHYIDVNIHQTPELKERNEHQTLSVRFLIIHGAAVSYELQQHRKTIKQTRRWHNIISELK